MPKGYHLTCEERCQIHALEKSGRSVPAIATQLGRDRLTILREIRRSGGGRGYRHAQAQRKADARRSAASSAWSRMTPELWAMVEEREGWSPERISGHLWQEGHPMADRELTCRYVHADRKRGGTLWRFLWRRGNRPNWKGGRHAGRGTFRGRGDIPERPAEVEAKEWLGDWEADTIVGRATAGRRWCRWWTGPRNSCLSSGLAGRRRRPSGMR